MNLSETVRSIVLAKQVFAEDPVELEETAQGSRFRPIRVRYEGAFWALRLEHNQHLPFLADLKKELNPRRLPDYLIFAHPKAPGGPDLLVLVCEMKSSETGGEDAVRQVQLGVFVAEYLAHIAQYNMAQHGRPNVHITGAIAIAGLPGHVQPRRRAKGRGLDYQQADNPHGDPIYKIPDGGEIHLEAFF